jgi:hypothetical protein
MAVRSYSQQKAALTRAIKKGKEAVLTEVKRAVAEWESGEAPYNHGWPDDWSRWQRAVDDVMPWYANQPIDRL